MEIPQATGNIYHPEAPWVLLCGPTCIGKTYFCKKHGFYAVRKLCPRHGFYSTGLNSREFKNIPILNWAKSYLHHHNVVTTSNPQYWPTNWYSNQYVIKFIAILLGTPYNIWQERVKMRGGDKSLITTSNFYNKYTTWIKNLKKYDIPYILVDNRDEFPILEEADFLKMLV